MTKNYHVMKALVTHKDAEGNVLWESGELTNILHDEGEQAILSAYFDTDLAGFGAPPANLYVGLDDRATLAEADVLTTLVEPTSTGGYSRKAVSTSTGFTLSQPDAGYRATTGTINFASTGAAFSRSVRNLFVCTAASGTSGKLLISLPLSTSRTIGANESIDCTFYAALYESA